MKKILLITLITLTLVGCEGVGGFRLGMNDTIQTQQQIVV